MSTEIEQLRLLDRDDAAETEALARKLWGKHGVKLRIAVPDSDDIIPGYNAPPLVAPIAPASVLAAEPAKGEVKHDQLVSSIRAALTFAGGLLTMVGALRPGVFDAWFNQYSALITIGVGLLLPAIARLWSLRQSKQKAKEKAQEVTTALSLAPERADGTPTTVEDVKQITQEAVATAKADLVTSTIKGGIV